MFLRPRIPSAQIESSTTVFFLSWGFAELCSIFNIFGPWNFKAKVKVLARATELFFNRKMYISWTLLFLQYSLDFTENWIKDVFSFQSFTNVVSYNCLQSANILNDDCLTTAWQLPNNCLMTAWRLPDDCLTAWWLPDDCPDNKTWNDGKMKWWPKIGIGPRGLAVKKSFLLLIYKED